MIEIKKLSTTEIISDYSQNHLNDVSFIVQDNKNNILKMAGTGLQPAILGDTSISGSVIDRLSNIENKVNILQSYESNAAHSASLATLKAQEAADSATSAAQSATEAANSANIVNDAALKSSDNIFTATNTYNSVITFNDNAIRTSEVWASNQIPSIGMQDVLNYYHTLSTCQFFNARGNPNNNISFPTAYVDTTTSIIPQTPNEWGSGWQKAPCIYPAASHSASSIVSAWFKINTGISYVFCMAAGESMPWHNAAVPNHEWAVVESYKNYPTTDIQILSPKAAKNLETLVLYKNYQQQCTTAAWKDVNDVTFWLEIPCVWLYDAFNQVQSLSISIAGFNTTQKYISIMGDSNLSAWKKLPKWSEGYIYSQTNYGEYNYAYVSSQGLIYSKGKNCTSDKAAAKCFLYEYNGAYKLLDPENCLKFNIKNQTSTKKEGYSGVGWDMKDKMGVHMVPYRIISNELIEDPTSEDLVWEEHSNLDRLQFPASGGYLYIRYKADYTDSGYYRYLMEPTHENIEVVDEWMPYGNLWCQGSMDTNTWISREETYRGERHTELHAWATPKRWRYAYVEIPENTYAEQRDTWVFAGLTGFEGIVYRIIQKGAAIEEETTEETETTE